MLLRCGLHTLDLATPKVMGVLNVTPDSFSDGGRFGDPVVALEHAHKMIEEGAAIIDVGGESTRPGAVEVPVDEELRRVIPVVRALSLHTDGIVSVDTSRAEVMRAAIDAGASIVNDIRALRSPGAVQAVAESAVAVCLMHMQGEPRTMQTAPAYSDVLADVRQFLADRMAACENAGISHERILLDPGIGFGKTQDHNLALLAGLRGFVPLGRPVLVGVSRKSLIGALTGKPVEARLAGGLAFATAAVLSGASIIRTHDVAPTLDAVKIATALRAAGLRANNRED